MSEIKTDDQSAIVRKYDESNNESGSVIMGVPMRDLTRQEWESFPTWIQQSIDYSQFWSIPEGAPADAYEAAKEQKAAAEQQARTTPVSSQAGSQSTEAQKEG